MTDQTTGPWVATDEDCETGYLIDAPADLTPEDALALFLERFRAEFGAVRAVDNEPLHAELRPFREPREGDPCHGDATLVGCAAYEEPTAMVWVIEGIDWYASTAEACASEGTRGHE